MSLKSCFHFPEHCSAGMKPSYFPWGLARPKNRHIIFYHNWMCLRSSTAWPQPPHVKSGSFSTARGLSLVQDGPRLAFEQYFTIAAAGAELRVSGRVRSWQRRASMGWFRDRLNSHPKC